ncbi:ribosomal-protein-S5p-alanine acetyltransferase [Cutibacterium acnes JCM 18920]|nr:ribosomal-protein-S5p-alanine acetyltransferase [Cutibacterium acnes JCM 18920]
MMITRNRRRAKQGTSLPWAIGWDDGWPDHPASTETLRLLSDN